MDSHRVWTPCLALLAFFAFPARLAHAAGATDLPAPTETAHGEDGSVLAVHFDEAVARAVQHNPTVLRAVQAIHEAEALLSQARAASLPAISARASYTRLDADRIAAGGTIALPADSFNVGLSVSVPLLAPHDWLQWKRAREDIDVARAAERDVQRQVALATARTYLAVITQRRLLEITESSQLAARAQYELARTRFLGDVGTRIDVARAAEEVAGLESTLGGLRVGLVRAREALGVLAGSDGPLDATDLALPDALPSPEEAVGAVNRRADVDLARRRLTLAKARYGDRWADLLPTVTGTFQPGYQAPPLLTVPTLGWQATVNLNLPLYDGGLRYGTWRQNAVRADEARIDLEAALRQASSEVRIAFETIRRADEGARSANEAATFAEEALGLAVLKYRAGASTNFETIDAERRAREAHTRAAIAEDSARNARLDLLSATARFP